MEHLANKQKITIMLASMASMLFASLNQTIVGTALPHIVSQLGGMKYFNWVFTIFMLTSSITAILVGKLSDMYGRKPFILAGLGTFIIGSFLCGTSTDMFQLIAYRGLQGFGCGMIISTSFAAIGDLFPPRERGRWQGAMTATYGLASVIGPTLGGYIVDNFNWEWVFWIFLPVGAIAFFFIWRMFPQATQRNHTSIDYAGSVFLTVTIVPLLLAFSWAGRDYAWSSLTILALFAISLISLALFIWIENRAENPVLPLHLFKISSFNLANIIVFLIGMGMFVVIMYMPFYIQGVMGISAEKTGLFMMAITLSMVVSSVLSGQIISKTGKYKKLGLLGLLFMGSGMFLLSTMNPGTSHLILGGYLALTGFGLGLSLSLYNLVSQNSVPQSHLGVATSASQLFRQMGGTIGVSIMGGIMLTRMQSRISSSLAQAPESFSKLTALKDPEILLSPDKLATIKAELPANLNTSFTQLLHHLREAMGFALDGVFLTGSGILAFAFLLACFLKEIPLRTSN
ncbi:drug resistance transporter, EmrB/QacA subfamily [Marininema mesophilum]|uniref:Drug resistance transporter, EmrB/QacA subfamily n=1 Tax=Marininema mesophilum TaxID=1048340 RepID=A0A1H2XQ85_9BACL|nr:MDR family MFS transporter [Marininema mesophilum]SDW94990.1 drug resistance transporter, EmrB/QacA subfamily [Marininema mesophilum]